MKKILFILVLMILGCSEKTENIGSSPVENSVERVSYKEFLNQIKSKTEAEKRKYFLRYINYDIPEYWQGTPWSFGGTTRNPQSGTIACGYFVTNILSDFGIKIERVYLAQQPSSVMIKKLCTEIKYFNKREDLENYILSKPQNTVYIVGLDFHTGFITRENRDTYFIHSNYIQNKGVVKEKTESSKALNASKTYMIGTLKY
ncbi:hypothetical protein [Chryseobacterium sp. Leaf394]|uniref:hypothetical protein n=1 Tax=Chryseobacterium sp. Leaf394 TaxID=1736361 RepID=UPI000FF888E2|nr:hypothetical protein [Chryseobacterium sp. Leaf394]